MRTSEEPIRSNPNLNFIDDDGRVVLDRSDGLHLNRYIFRLGYASEKTYANSLDAVLDKAHSLFCFSRALFFLKKPLLNTAARKRYEEHRLKKYDAVREKRREYIWYKDAVDAEMIANTSERVEPVILFTDKDFLNWDYDPILTYDTLQSKCFVPSYKILMYIQSTKCGIAYFYQSELGTNNLVFIVPASKLLK